MDLKNNETKKYLLPLILAAVGFLVSLIGALFNGYFGANIGRIFFQLILACILPAVLLLLYSSKTAAKSAKVLLYIGLGLLVLQAIGLLYTAICALIGTSYGLFRWIPGSTVLGNLINMIRTVFNCFRYGFSGFRYVLCNLFYAIGALAMLLSNLFFILISSEFHPIAQLNGMRESLYRGLKLPMSDFVAQGGDAADAPIFSEPKAAPQPDAAPQANAAPQAGAAPQAAPQRAPQPTPQYSAANVSVELLGRKSIVACILLSIITCGIYGLVWNYAIMKKIRLLNQNYSSPVGEFLCFIFVPFYALYWYFTRAGRLSTGAAAYGLRIGNNGVLYLILAIFGFSIINICLIQNDLNTIADALTGQRTAPNFATQATNEFNSAYQDVTGAAQNVTSHAAPQPAAPAQDPVEQLEKLNKLREMGAITDEEFQEKKADLLKRI